MAKVYIINDSNHNFDDAKRYGELRYVTKGKVPIFKTGATKSLLIEGLKDFDHTNDYLLVSGPSLLCMQAALLLCNGDNKVIKTLVFDAKEQSYIVRHLVV